LECDSSLPLLTKEAQANQMIIRAQNAVAPFLASKIAPESLSQGNATTVKAAASRRTP
jgi:hypothetical protein